jgi:hypothetical protein
MLLSFSEAILFPQVDRVVYILTYFLEKVAYIGYAKGFGKSKSDMI